MSSKQKNAIGIMGGMFDPVHHGHLRAAVEFAEAFSLSQVQLLPCHQPPHREFPQVSSWQRKEMLELAISGSEILSIDDRELKLDKPSYTVASLQQLRKELGEDTALYFALGADAFNSIDTWKDWQGLFELANFVVMHRPAVKIIYANQFLEDKCCEFNGHGTAFGNVYELTITALDVSSTKIRQLIQANQSIKFLLPDAVEQYIYQHQLYR